MMKEEYGKTLPTFPTFPRAKKIRWLVPGRRAGGTFEATFPEASVRIRAPWELPPEPPHLPDMTWKKHRARRCSRTANHPGWLAEVME